MKTRLLFDSPESAATWVVRAQAHGGIERSLIEYRDGADEVEVLAEYDRIPEDLIDPDAGLDEVEEY